MSIGKKILLVFLAITLVGAAAFSIWYFSKDKEKEVTDAMAKNALTTSVEFMENIYSTSVMQNAEKITATANAMNGGVVSNQIAVNENFEEADFSLETLTYVMRYPGLFLTMANFLTRNEELAFGKTLYGEWDETRDAIMYFYMDKTDYGLRIEMSPTYGDDADRYEAYAINVYYDYEDESVECVDLHMIYTSEDSNENVFLKFDVVNGTFYGVNMKYVDHQDLINDVKDTLTNDDLVKYYGEYILAATSKIDYNDINLSRISGFEIYPNEGESTANYTMTEFQRNLFRECLVKYVNSYPTKESAGISNIDKTNNNMSFMLEDAYVYAMGKYNHSVGTDANGNLKLYSSFVEYEDQKAELNNLISIVNQPKPHYANNSYSSSILSNGTKSISVTRLNGLLNSMKTYMDSKTADNYIGLVNVTYGNYKFFLFNADRPRHYLSALGHEVYDENEFIMSVEDEEDILCRELEAVYSAPNGDKTYIRLIYALDFNGNIIYITYNEGTVGDEGLTDIKYYEYVNTATNKGVAYGELTFNTDFRDEGGYIPFNDHEDTFNAVDTFYGMIYVDGMTAPKYSRDGDNKLYVEMNLDSDKILEVTSVLPTDTTANTDNSFADDEWSHASGVRVNAYLSNTVYGWFVDSHRYYTEQ